MTRDPRDEQLYHIEFALEDHFGTPTWDSAVDDSTLGELRADNAHDESLADVWEKLAALAVGESFVLDLGAGGVNRYTRIR